MIGIVQRNGWVAGLAVLLALLLLATKIIQPNFGASGMESLARAAVPFAFATAAMAIVVIAGGIDLSVAAMMAVASVTAARLMVGAGDGQTVLIVIGVLALGGLMGAINGILIVLTRVPDIVATLAMLFVWEGVALLILNTPSGAATQWLRDMILGSVGPVPKSLIFIVVFLAPAWLLLRRTQLGLAIYAIGSDPTAAFRSGVPIGKTRVAAYCLAGILAALGGLTPDDEHRDWRADPRPLSAGLCVRRGSWRRGPDGGQGRADRADHCGADPAAGADGPDPAVG